MLAKTLLTATLALPLISAHFTLNYPPTIGFDDDKEGTGPCGSFSIALRNTVTDWPVVGGPIALTSTHPGAVWIFKAALLNDTANLVDISEAVSQEGQGNFCQTGSVVPASWAGLEGVIQVTQDATDGSLYQCAAVNFTAGAFTGSLPTTCRNVTGLVATYTTISAAGSSATSTGSSAGSSSSTTTPSATSTSAGAAAATSKGAAAIYGYSGVVLMGAMGIAAALV